jgi:hypothetical protein
MLRLENKSCNRYLIRKELLFCSAITKTTFLSILFLFVGCSASIKTTDVPEPATLSLSSLFPGVGKVNWTKRNKAYIADFIYNDSVKSITLKQNGEITSRVDQVDFSKLPKRALKIVEKDYAGYKAVIILKTARRTSCEYDIELVMGLNHLILNFNDSGQLLHRYYAEKEIIRGI